MKVATWRPSRRRCSTCGNPASPFCALGGAETPHVATHSKQGVGHRNESTKIGRPSTCVHKRATLRTALRAQASSNCPEGPWTLRASRALRARTALRNPKGPSHLARLCTHVGGRPIGRLAIGTNPGRPGDGCTMFAGANTHPRAAKPRRSGNRLGRQMPLESHYDIYKGERMVWLRGKKWRASLRNKLTPRVRRTLAKPPKVAPGHLGSLAHNLLRG